MALKNQGLNLIEFDFINPENFIFPENDYFLKNNIAVVISFYAGKCLILEKGLKRIKEELGIIIVCELGDEPQTLIHNDIIASIANISLSPDYRSSLYWQNQGYNCKWFTHWADTSIYKNNNEIKRDIFMGTSMGKRKYDLLLKIILGPLYVNKISNPKKNAELYQRSKIVFQYARWGEITRRIFEAAACNCCILTNKLESHTQIETIFANNVSIIYYDGFFSLLYQLLRLKLKPNLYKKISKNAKNIVLNHHTEKIRAKYLISLIKLELLKKSDPI